VERSDEQFVLHLVGNLRPEDARRVEFDERIESHGRMAPHEIAFLARSCSVGLSSFALDRMGMSQACTLKVRDYLQGGLPVYAGHRDVFPEEFPFYRCGQPDIKKILDFARSVDANASAIATAARPLIEKAILLSQFHSSLESHFG
jgi:hypothetical protein